MLKIITQSGSIYFIDTVSNLFKRAPKEEGAKFSSDSYWENYGYMEPNPPKIGESLHFVYCKSPQAKFVNTLKTTKVVDIIEC